MVLLRVPLVLFIVRHLANAYLGVPAADGGHEHSAYSESMLWVGTAECMDVKDAVIMDSMD